MNPVFHVSQLKGRVGRTEAVSPNLPLINPQVRDSKVPEKILQRRAVKRHNVAVPQALVQWKSQGEEEATWEDYEELAHRYPQFILEDKEAFMRGVMSESHMMEAGKKEEEKDGSSSKKNELETGQFGLEGGAMELAQGIKG